MVPKEEKTCFRQACMTAGVAYGFEGGRHRRLAERQLIAAVIGRAILDAYSTTISIPAGARRSAYAWIKSKNEQGYSFRWCCNVLEIPYSAILWRLKDKKYVEKICEVLARQTNPTIDRR